MKLQVADRDEGAIRIAQVAPKAVGSPTRRVHRLRLARTVTVLAWICLAAAAAPTVTEAQEVNIPDENLRAEIEAALGKRSGETITVADMESLTELDAGFAYIENLTGLEHATELIELDLRINEIVDLAPLADLTSLEDLSLWSNRISNLAPLAGLRSLQSLNLGDNLISNVAPLSGLESLESLQLWRNRISDVAPLAGLTSLRWLLLSENRISDPVPLAGLTSLTQLTLSDNGVSDLSPLSGIASLEFLQLANNGIWDLSPLAGLTSLEQLVLSDNAITDLAPLSALTSLRRLDVRGNAISDLSPLSGLAVGTLYLSDNRISDLSPLTGMTPSALLLSDNAISDVSPLAGLTSLSTLWLSANRISDLLPLAGLASLSELRLEDNRISDVASLAGLTSLYSLRLSGNRISDLRPLANMAALEHLHLPGNEISDLSPLSGLTSVFDLGLGDNQIIDVEPLADLTAMAFLNLSDNQISDLSPLSDMTELGWLYLSGNSISDISPLSSLPGVFILHLADNEISDLAPLRGKFILEIDLSRNGMSVIPPLSGVLAGTLDLSDNGISDISPLSAAVFTAIVDLSNNQITDVSPLSGMDLLRLCLSNNEIADLSPLEGLQYLEILDAAANQLVDVALAASLPSLQSLDLGGNVIDDAMPLAIEPASLRRASLWRNPLDADSVNVHLPALRERGVRVAGGGWRVPFFPPPGGFRQGFVRVASSVVGEPAFGTDPSDEAWVYATRHDVGPARLQLGDRNARHFNADDLVAGNPVKGLRSAIGLDAGDRLDVYASADIDVLSYVRTSDGFVTSMHDTVPWLPPDHVRLDVLRGRSVEESGRAAGGHFVPLFNPASNPNQRSMLRLVNPGDEDVNVAVYAVDDHGAAAGPIRFSLPAQSSRALSATELEAGNAPGSSGSLGDGEGKWRLVVSADAEIHVMNLMSSPTGHLTNLSTSSDGTLTVPMFPAASHPTQQGFVRVANLGNTAGTAEIRGYDDHGTSYGPLVLQLPAGHTVHFNSDDWENGNTDKGLEGAAGTGEGAWRLKLESTLDLEVAAYVRTADGFLTSMHDLVQRDTCAVEEAAGEHIAARSEREVAFRPCRDERRIPFFNPASNTRQVSSLRLVNRGAADAAITIFGVDDEGAERGPALLTLPTSTARTLTSLELESGDGDGLNGALGDGTGKWELRVFVAGEAAADVMVMSLLESPTGHLTNLSTWPNDELRLE